MIDSTARINIRLMGAPEISIGGIPLVINHIKSRALLFYLAATRQPQTRDHLATLLWGESGQREAYHSLRSSLYHLRQALRAHQVEGRLKSDGESLSLDLAPNECDVTEFQRLTARGAEEALTQAVALRRGPFLQGFTITDAPTFDDWMQTENTRLDHACFGALENLIVWAEAREAWPVAIGYARQMIQLDPFAETAQQRLLRLYLRQGEVALALRQYRQFEQQLKQELGILPAPETKALYEEILHQQRNPARPTTAPGHLSTRQFNLLPFVGRDNLLHDLAVISEDVKAGCGTTILIQGEGGIGKSRLVDEFTSHLIAGSPPWVVLQGACSPFDDLLSQGPFIEALQNGAAEGLSDFPAESNARVPDARGQFSWRVLQAIRAMTHDAPLILCIEDLQWANSATLNLFGFLSMRLRHLPVMLVGTVQHPDAIPALKRLITLERRRRELYLFSLMPLTLKAISELLQASEINPNSVETLAEWLEAKSAGNPFLLSEILAQLRVESILKQTSGGWHLETMQWLRWRTAFSLPETTHDLVGWRLANLSPEARNLLDILAVAATPIPEAVLHNLPGLWTNAFPTHVDDLLEHGLILELPGNALLTLPHHLLREALLHRLSNLRRRAIHRQLAEALELQISPDNDTWLRQIALHAVAGEDVERARHYGMRVVSNLQLEYTGAETADFVQHLHDLLAPTASAVEMERIAHALGILHQVLGHLEVAGHWHRQTLDWAKKADDFAVQAEAYFEMSELALISNDYRTALQAAQNGLTTLGASSAENPSLPSGRQLLTGKGHRLVGAALAMEGRDLAAAEEHLHKAVAIHRQIENQGDLCAILFELGNVAAQRGELQRALDFYDESGRVAETEHIHYYLALARNNFAYHSLLLGQVDAAQQAVADGIKIAETYGLFAALLHLYSTKGEIFLHLHEWQEAEAAFQSGLALAEEFGSLERQAGYRGGLALAARGRKDYETAHHLLDEALALITGQGYWHLRTRLQLWLAETLFDQTRYADAEKLLDEALEIARAQQRTLLVEQGEHLRTQLAAKQRNYGVPHN